MALVDTIDFEGNGGSSANQNQNGNNQNRDDNAANLNGEQEKANLDNPDNSGNGGNQDQNNNPDNNNNGDNNGGNQDNNNGNQDNNNGEGDNPSTGGDIKLNPGDSINFDGVDYHVADNGDIVDEKGNVFKAAAEVADWLKEQDVNDDTNSDGPIDINNIIKEVGIDITDEEGNPIEFTNDAAGVKGYINSVLELRSSEIADATLNKFFTDAPIVKDFLDYLTINGTPRGFGEIRDLSNVKLDKDNEAQLENVIRAAAKEFGNTTLSDSYIKYLKDSGGLYDEANRQLQAMVDRDNAEKAEREEQAKAARQQEQENLRNYWDAVNKQIQSGNIAGYKIPETFVLERDGQKITTSRSDFWDYLTIEDRETGLTGYRRDLASMSDHDVMEHELLDAYLHFTGKSYKDLINMAVQEEKAKQLRIQSKQNANRGSIRITRKPSGKTNLDDILIGG